MIQYYIWQRDAEAAQCRRSEDRQTGLERRAAGGDENGNYGRHITNRQKFVAFTAGDLINLTLRPGLIIPQTSDDSLFA